MSTSGTRRVSAADVAPADSDTPIRSSPKGAATARPSHGEDRARATSSPRRSGQSRLRPSPSRASTAAAGSADGNAIDDERRRLEDAFRFGSDILQKKYELYMWCETKTYNLLTADGALLAAIFLLLNATGGFSGHVAVWLVGIAAAVLVLVSVVISLMNIIPRMDSGATSRRNLRSVIGTNNFSNYEDYHTALSKLDLAAMVHSNSEQIYGMNRNVWESQKAIRQSVWFTAAGVAALAIFAVLASTTGLDGG